MHSDDSIGLKTRYMITLQTFWAYAPGSSSPEQASSEQMLRPYLNNPDKIFNVAIALGFVADEELLLAGNLLARGEISRAWEWMDRAQAHAALTYAIYDLEVWRPSQYTRQIFSIVYFCTHFALALARGTESSIRWYAQQVYNLIQGGLADNCCSATEYVDFYFDIAVTILHGEWRPADRLEERAEIYRNLFLSVGDEGAVREALRACAQYHLQVTSTSADSDDESVHPFRSRAIGHIAYELLAWIALYKRFYGPLQWEGLHPMLLNCFMNPEPQRSFSDSMIEQLTLSADAALGVGWQNSAPPSIEEMA